MILPSIPTMILEFIWDLEFSISASRDWSSDLSGRLTHLKVRLYRAALSAAGKRCRYSVH